MMRLNSLAFKKHRSGNIWGQRDIWKHQVNKYCDNEAVITNCSFFYALHLLLSWKPIFPVPFFFPLSSVILHERSVFWQNQNSFSYITSQVFAFLRTFSAHWHQVGGFFCLEYQWCRKCNKQNLNEKVTSVSGFIWPLQSDVTKPLSQSLDQF